MVMHIEEPKVHSVAVTKFNTCWSV